MKFTKFVRKYRIKSVFVRNFIVSLLVMLVPMMIINMLVMGFYNGKASEHAEKELYSVKEKVDKVFEWVVSNRDYMSNDIYVTLFLHDMYDNENVPTMTNIIKGHIDKIRLMGSGVEDVYIYSKKTGYVMSSIGSGDVHDFEKFRLWECISDTGNTFIRMYDNIDGRKIIRVQLPLDLNEFLPAGTLIVDIDYEIFQKDIAKQLSSNCYVSVGYGDKTFMEVGTPIKGGKSFYEESGIADVYYQYDFSTSGAAIPLFLLVLVSSLIFAVLAACFLTYKASAPISDVIDIMENTLPSGQEYENQKLAGEAMYILKTYLDKVHYSKEIEKNLRERMADLKNIQLQSLTLQIRPHFLFNTLQLISICAMNLTGEENDAVVAIEKLSKILQYSFKSNAYIETLNDEVEFTRVYADIQNLRYNDRVTVTFDIAEDVKNNVTAKMILQPLVENSFSHGIIPHRREGNILVKAYADGELLKIEVIDDGVGMTADIRNEITSRLASDKNIENEHIGLFNIDRKIKLIFGEQYGLAIDDSFTNGTRIVVIQPLLGK